MEIKVYASTLVTPTQWVAGRWGKDKAPIYFSCCKCDAKDPPIAGFFTTNPEDKTIESILIYEEKESPLIRLALYCEKCWPLVKDVGPEKEGIKVRRL